MPPLAVRCEAFVLTGGTGVFDIVRAAVQVHLSGLHSAVKILGGRVKVIVQYLAAVKKGLLPAFVCVSDRCES
jgi:hypothetical protein